MTERRPASKARSAPAHDPFADPVSSLDGLDAVTLPETATYGEALAEMRRRRAGSVLILRGAKISGIFTERDVLNACLLEKTPATTPIAKLMTATPLTVSPATTVAQAIAAMHSRHVRNLPVVDASGRPRGLLTVGRLIRHLAAHFPAAVVNLPPMPGQISEEVEGA